MASARALSQALALGLIHGPAELLPISSSSHTELIPWLLGWDQQTDAPAELRKAFEVALHGGTAAALSIVLRRELAESLHSMSRTRVEVIALSLLIPSAVGFALERPIEERLGTPRRMALALICGAALLALADRSPQRRRETEAVAADGLCLGLAQACALIPGISRNGATLTAARSRGFARADAQRLSRHAALPVIGGATALKLVRLSREALPAGARARLLVGAAAAFASTFASTRMIEPLVRDRPLWPFALYRVAFGGLVLLRTARQRHATMRP